MQRLASFDGDKSSFDQNYSIVSIVRYLSSISGIDNNYSRTMPPLNCEKILHMAKMQP